MDYLDALGEDCLHQTPAFRVDPPDKQRHISEIERQVAFLNTMKALAPRVLVFANANAGRRNPRQAKREGIMAGVFDITAVWDGGIAWPEFKGYDKNGRAGSLSASQIDWGNAMTARGKAVACFFSPMEAVSWLRDLGAPVREAR
jgi:hypothetical protein